MILNNGLNKGRLSKICLNSKNLIVKKFYCSVQLRDYNVQEACDLEDNRELPQFVQDIHNEPCKNDDVISMKY